MKNNILCFILLLVSSIGVQGQSVSLEFPYFSGKTYTFKIVQGERHIVLKEDTIPVGGKVQLVLPEAYTGYKGMALWYLSNSQTGGGLDLIIGNEDFSVSCLDSIPNSQNIVYTNSKEHIFHTKNYVKQQELFKKHDALLATLNAYEPKAKLYKLAVKENERNKKAYEAYFHALSTSTLYAAKFRQIVNLTKGIGPRIVLDETERAQEINNFILYDLDYEVLYTSNHWGGIIKNWVQLQTHVFNNDAKMIADAQTILGRLTTNKIYTDFVETLTKALTAVGKDTVLAELIPVVKSSKKLQRFTGVLHLYQLDLAGKAPDIILDGHQETAESGSVVPTVLKTDALNSGYSVVLFYQSGCGPCIDTIDTLKANYDYLEAKGIQIVAISADTDPDVFSHYASEFPWKANTYCDLQGVDGVNFKNYGVLGTPTMFILDSQGLIVKKLARADALIEWSTGISSF